MERKLKEMDNKQRSILIENNKPEDQELIQFYLDNCKKHYLDNYMVHDLQPYTIEGDYCDCDHKPLFEKILAKDLTQDDAMAYKSCMHTIYAAAKRQMKAAPTPTTRVANDFVNYCKKIIDKEVGEELRHFSYSYQDWYNHLTAAKQQDMDIVANILNKTPESLNYTPKDIKDFTTDTYDGICKVEIQAQDGKPRMVCSIPKKFKYVMGPVTWKLEEIFQDNLHGYCGGKNLDEMADKINTYIDQGFVKVVEGDGSAFDNTQDVSLKEVDRYIYQQVYHAIHHVPLNIFKKVSQSRTKKMRLSYRNKKGKQEELMTYTILGSVFSGDCDTTLCNTIRMAMYNRYVNDRAGLVYGQDYVCFSKGDDFTVMYKPYVSNAFIEQAYYRYFLKANPDPSKPDTRVFGLGQVLKMLDFGNAATVKFCSLRAWFKDDNHIILTRDPAKFLKLSKFSRKTKTMSIQQKALYMIDQAVSIQKSFKGITYFDTMARAYLEESKRLVNTYGVTQKDVEKVKQRQARRNLKDSRKPTTPLAMDENDEYVKLIYAIKGRHTWKIQKYDDYWESMKEEEMVRREVLTQQQLELINQQIEEEFSTEELKTLMGLKNEH